MAKIYILPNGKKVKVDSHIGKAGAIDIAVRNGIMTRDEAGYEPEVGASDDSSFGQNLLEGTGRGMVNIARNVGNLMGMEGYSDEELREANRLDESLMSTGGGMIGSAVGETALTLPIGGAALAGAKAGVKGLQAARGLAGAARGGQVGGRVGALPLALAGATEGASVGALAAGPDDRGAGALIGGLAGGTLSGVGSGLRRMREGMVKTSDDAASYIARAKAAGVDTELPVTMAADRGGLSGMVASISDKLEALPGLTRVSKISKDKATKDYAEVVIREAAPKGFKGTLTKGGTVQEVVEDLTKFYKKGYADSVGGHVFNAGEDFMGAAFRRVDDQIDELGEGAVEAAKEKFAQIISRYAKDGVIDGADIGIIKSRIAREAAEFGDSRMSKAIRNMTGGLDDMIEEQLSIGTKNLGDLAKFKNLNSKYGNYMDLEDLSHRARKTEGMFTPQQHLDTIAARGSKADVAQGLARSQKATQQAARTVGRTPEKPDMIDRMVGYFALGGGGAAAAPATIAVYLTALASKLPSGQRALLGNTAIQKGIADILKTKTGTEASKAIRALLRRGTAATLAEGQRDAT